MIAARLRSTLSTALLLAVALIACVGTPAFAVDSEPALSEAECAIVMDSEGNVLWSMNADEEMAMASTTKVMTAIVALESGVDLDMVCTINPVDLGPYSQTAGFTSSDTPTMRDLLRVMLVYSGNDAACYIAQNVAGSEEAFVELMNQKAAELGMTHTHYANPHGLEEEGHYSSAADLAIMGRYALETHPFIASTVRLRSVTAVVAGAWQTFPSTDALMDYYPGLLGIKTGSVAAGTVFVGAARRGGITLYTAVMGCDTSAGRFNDTAALLDWAYANYVPRNVGRTRWILDVAPYALDFRFDCVASATTNTMAPVWPDGGGLAYSNTHRSFWLVAEPGDEYGMVSWSQDGRDICQVRSAYRSLLVRVPAINQFALALFVDTDELGERSS